MKRITVGQLFDGQLCLKDEFNYDSYQPPATIIIENALNAILDVKGKHPIVMKAPAGYSECDYCLVVSARSDRQAQGISNKVINVLSELGCQPDSVEGLDAGQWVLLDYGDVVIHVFYEPVREHYDIEGLWETEQKFEVMEGE